MKFLKTLAIIVLTELVVVATFCYALYWILIHV